MTQSDLNSYLSLSLSKEGFKIKQIADLLFSYFKFSDPLKDISK